MKPMEHDPYREPMQVPGITRFPVELRPPPGFRPDRPETWPKVPGRLEYVGGRLLYLTPCGDRQLFVVGSVAGILDRWLDEHSEFTFGTNEAGLLLDHEARGADAAVWRRDSLGPSSGGFIRVPPILAVEASGRDEGEAELRDKAAWYLDHAVQIVWIVLVDAREVLVLTRKGEVRCRQGERIPAAPELPGLEPAVERFFARVD